MFRKQEKPFVSAVIAAGGSSSRMKGENKLLTLLCGTPVLIHTIKAFENSPDIDEIILSAKADMLREYADLVAEYGFSKLKKVVCGGDTRLQSVYNAAIECSPKASFIAVHDGARPLITADEIQLVLEKAKIYKCAAAGYPASDTVKQTDGILIEKTVDRSTLALVQTPQIADRDLLLAALKKAIDDKDGKVTDECSAIERLGIRPALAVCSHENIKITYPEDVFIADAIMQRRDAACR